MMNKAVIYARYSSSNQTEQSIDGQLRVCKEYALRNNLNVIREYIDRAKTGTSALRRTEFQQMIQDAKIGAFDNIIVYQYDRFARSRHDSIVYKTKLKSLNVKVISATEPSSDSPDNIIIEGMLESLAEYYSADLSKKAKRGIKESILKRQSIGGRPILGYNFVNKKVVVDQDKAEMVRFIFKEYSEGKTIRQITDYLNQLGLKTTTGGKFIHSSLQTMLSNKKYIGEFYFHGELIENYYPQIVDKETFDKVQAIRQKNKHKGSKYNRNNRVYPLSNLIHCPHCGSEMTGISGNSKTGRKYYYYKCKQCKSSSIPANGIEELIFNEIYNFILKPDNLNDIVDFMTNAMKKSSNATVIRRLQKSINTIELDLRKLADSFIRANSEMQLVLNEKATELTEKKEALESELNKVLLMDKIKPQKEALKHFIKNISFETDEREEIIKMLTKKIFIFEDVILVYMSVDNDVVDYKKALKDYESMSEKTSSSVKAIGRASRIRTQMLVFH